METEGWQRYSRRSVEGNSRTTRRRSGSRSRSVTDPLPLRLQLDGGVGIQIFLRRPCLANADASALRSQRRNEPGEADTHGPNGLVDVRSLCPIFQ